MGWYGVTEYPLCHNVLRGRLEPYPLQHKEIHVLRTALLALSIALAPVGYGVLSPVVAVASALPGDDNGDGAVLEDESGWDCNTMGNRICG